MNALVKKTFYMILCLEYLKRKNNGHCHYFSSPGLSWDAMLKTTEIALQLISDIGMYLFTEKAMRGGISYIAKTFSKANNKYMKSYDNSKPSNNMGSESMSSL